MKPCVVITGATSGIGLSCARKFAAHDWDLWLIGRRRQRLEALQSELKEKNDIDVFTSVLDVRDAKAVSNTFQKNPSLLGRVTILVNNAGLASGLDFLQEGSIQDWDQMIDTNLKGLLYVTREVLPSMVKRKTGHVIQIGSIAGRQVYPKGNVYCATKHAVKAINEALRLDLNGTGIRVSTVDPGLCETEFSEVRFHGDKERAKQVYANVKALEPDDVAEAVFWVSSQPQHVNVQEVLLMPTAQASATVVDRR